MIGRLVLVSVFTLVGLGEGEVSAIPPLVLLAKRHDSLHGLSLIIERERSKQVGLCSYREAVSPELLEYPAFRKHIRQVAHLLRLDWKVRMLALIDVFHWLQCFNPSAHESMLYHLQGIVTCFTTHGTFEHTYHKHSPRAHTHNGLSRSPSQGILCMLRED